jgi:type I restriction enzyme S subunit
MNCRDWGLLVLASKLSDYCHFVDGRVAVADLSLDSYISTENMLPNKEGITRSAGLPTVNQTRAYRADDVLVSNIRPYFRKIWLADRDGGCSSDVLVLRAKDVCNPGFLFFLLSDGNFFDYATATSKGTKMPRGDKDAIMLYAVPDVPLGAQIVIADTLFALEALIAENRKINHQLEQMAQAIFKSWFADFEPYGGVMPDDWREGALSDICCCNPLRVAVDALTLDTYISTENMTVNKGGFVKASSLPATTQTTAFEIGDTLVSNIRPYFKKIVFCGFAGGCSSDVLCFHPKKAGYSQYVYNALYSDSFFDFMLAGSKGTKMPRGDKQQIMGYHIAIPSNDALADFTAAVAPMSEKRLLLADESARLTELRDTLLPRLMSGEISIANAKDISRN